MKRISQLQLFLQYETEAELSSKVKEYLEVQPDVKLMRICDRYTKGYPDIITCVNGIFCAFELKDNTGKPSAHQTLFIKDMQRCGGLGGVVRTVGEVVYIVGQARCISNGCKRHNKK